MRVNDPIGREIEASFGLLNDATAVVEVAQASGLPLVAARDRDPLGATTTGSGELIVAAVAAGARSVLVAAGGSATTDGGAGAIEAILAAGGTRGTPMEILCDVTTPFEDAARVFAPQKGASAGEVVVLTARLNALAELLPRDPRGLPGSGCAGGLSGGLWAAFGASLRPGADYVLETAGFASRAAAAGAVISGEGRIDEQSFAGKVLGAVAGACRELGQPLHVVAGRNSLDSERAEAAGITSIREAGTPGEIARTAREIVRATS